MKKNILLLISFAFFECSNDGDYQSKIDEINKYYDSAVKRAEGDQIHIDLINEERSLKLKSSCK